MEFCIQHRVFHSMNVWTVYSYYACCKCFSVYASNARETWQCCTTLYCCVVQRTSEKREKLAFHCLEILRSMAPSCRLVCMFDCLLGTRFPFLCVFACMLAILSCMHACLFIGHSLFFCVRICHQLLGVLVCKCLMLYWAFVLLVYWPSRRSVCTFLFNRLLTGHHVFLFSECLPLCLLVHWPSCHSVFALLCVY